MAEKICLDTDVCIGIINGESRAERLRSLIFDSEIFVVSVTVFELYLRLDNLDKIANFLANASLISFDGNSAIQASNIYKELKSKGAIIDFRDVLIASSAMANNCTLATFNKKHFSKISNLKLLDI
ncbi:type II toxin-antitoxin system VapC family toxin [Candidatus Woesearchaeota archaeon]|nr:type II toxin-antitoxin system VapC family toxin [Candidatus Woesearchaeota archaeon]